MRQDATINWPEERLKELDNFKQVACDIELISFIKHQLGQNYWIFDDIKFVINSKSLLLYYYIVITRKENINKNI